MFKVKDHIGKVWVVYGVRKDETGKTEFLLHLGTIWQWNPCHRFTPVR